MGETKNIKNGFKASGVFPLNPREVLKRIPEMQEEIWSYGIDQALVDYLKETRAPKPMLVKRNKKINCEPGKSVTVSDLNVDFSNSKARKKPSAVAKRQRKTKASIEDLVLDEETGLFVTKTDLVSNEDTNEDQEDHLDLEEYLAISQNQDIIYNIINKEQESYLVWEGDFAISQHQDVSAPPSLIKVCIAVINSCFDQSVHRQKTSTMLTDPSFLKTTTKKSVERDPGKKKKITILSDVIIKAGPSTDVTALKEVSNKIENKPFISTSKSDIPECLQIKKENKNFKIIKTEHYKKAKDKKIDRKVKVTNASKGKKSTRGRISVKKRKNTSDSDSSSMFDMNEVLTIDDSDDETMDDYLVAEYLREQEEKENFEPTDITFGLHKIEYFENHDTIKKDDWIIARLTTKNTLKHFVVLEITNRIPTFKFVRKIKESKCEKGTTFTYPIVDDICTMDHSEDIITILPKPKITRRGQIVFDIDFSNFNIQ
ncbi:hypothetical protein PYW08_006086 [Mythimna loreyi]|uniref:Uncharacterized protein n=1 Tax=Mythimna loreyi TaxID=667449 RepID=A0ACC2QMQ4_9NEOP|nr:hypothetical protein PYW08_006086 [Mythimna loreyi]